MSAIPPGAVVAFEAYWRVKETGGPPAFIDLPVKLQQCWIAAADAVAAVERGRLLARLCERANAGDDLARVVADIIREHA